MQPSMKVGIVGRTGAGKSTIALTLSRILEIEKGTITIDGVDISKIALSKLREKVTMVPQDAALFKNTLHYNLDPTMTVPKERLLDLIEKANLPELLKKQIEEGKSILDVEVKAGGSNLSSGEKQLICMVRAIARGAKVVLMDEATSNIDIVTEKKILALIAGEMKEATVVTIAHRLNTII